MTHSPVGEPVGSKGLFGAFDEDEPAGSKDVVGLFEGDDLSLCWRVGWIKGSIWTDYGLFLYGFLVVLPRFSFWLVL